MVVADQPVDRERKERLIDRNNNGDQVAGGCKWIVGVDIGRRRWLILRISRTREERTDALLVVRISRPT